jgi:predicted DNA repair protein MutK
MLPNFGLITTIVPVVLNGVVGLISGLAVVVVWSLVNRLKLMRE